MNFRSDWSGSLIDGALSSGSLDVFVIKVGGDGAYSWKRTFGGQDTDGACGSCIDGSGNLFITGYFRYSVDFGTPFGGPSDSKDGSNLGNAFITRINADGSYGWTRTAGGPADDTGWAVAIDLNGYGYAVGDFKTAVGWTCDFEIDWGGSPDLQTSYSSSFSDIFITKFK